MNVRAAVLQKRAFLFSGGRLLKWKKAFETGIKSVDNEHKTLVRLIDKLEASMQPGGSREAMGVVLRELVEYVKFHFSNEEEVM